MKIFQFIFPTVLCISIAIVCNACAMVHKNTPTTPPTTPVANAAKDTVKLEAANAQEKVVEYLQMLQYNHTDTIIARVNRMIEAGGDNVTKGYLAFTAYNFFYNSKMMGQEGVAVKIAQDWFLNDKLPWPNEEGKFMLRTFVEFNKHSLIGMEAPELELQDSSGRKISLNSLDAEYTIVYFYTDDCPSCRLQTPQLVDFVNEYQSGVLAVYAVYADSKEQAWKDYINSNLYIYNPFIFWENVYDPDFSSGFQILYGVIKTPQMFLLDKEKRIIGRGLDVNALKELLQQKNSMRDETYSFIEAIFNPVKGNTEEICQLIDMFAQRCEGDTDAFRNIMSSIYQYMGMDEDYSMQAGGAYLAEKYILGNPDRWSKVYRDKVQRNLDAFNKNRLGEKVSNLQLERIDKSPIEIYDVTTEYKVLYFYRPNCGMCSEVTPKMAQIYNQFKEKLDIGFLAINLGGSYKEWIEYTGKIGAEWENLRGPEGNADEIYSKFHLENIPAIYLLKDNVVVAKGINDIELQEILNSIKQ